MNPAFVATFTALVDTLMPTFGRPVTHTNADGDEGTVQAILTEATVHEGDYGERAEVRWTLELAASTGAVVGDTFTEPGTVTADDPYPDEVVWTATQLLSDDGFTRTFAVRRETA